MPGRAPVLKGAGGCQTAEAATPERPPPLRGRVVQSCGGALRRKRVPRAESGGSHGWANPGGAVGLFGAARRRRFGSPAGSRADPDGFARHGREARSQDWVVYGRGGRHGRDTRFSWAREWWPQGCTSRRCKGLRAPYPGGRRRLQRTPGRWRTGGQKPPEASGSCPARARQASDLGPARLTPLRFFGRRGLIFSGPKTMMPTEAVAPAGTHRRHNSDHLSRPARTATASNLGSSATLCVLEARSSTPDESSVTRGGSPANQILGLPRFLAQNLVFSPARACRAGLGRACSPERDAPASLAENCEKSRAMTAAAAPSPGLGFRLWRGARSLLQVPGCAAPNRHGAVRRTCHRPPARRAPGPRPGRGRR